MSKRSEGPLHRNGRPGAAVPPGPSAQRTAALWKLLGEDRTDGAPVESPPPPSSGPPPPPPLDERVAKAWFDETGESPAGPTTALPGEVGAGGWDQPAAWEVEPLPESGGIAGLFSPGRVDGRAAAAPSGRARLAEMIEQLPTEPAQRVTPDDIEIDRPVVAPAAVWFWGDDDIFPGHTASAGRSGRAGRDGTSPPRQPTPAAARRLPRGGAGRAGSAGRPAPLAGTPEAGAADDPTEQPSKAAPGALKAIWARLSKPIGG